MKQRTHRDRKNKRQRRLRELIQASQIKGVRLGHFWRINEAFDYWPNTGRVLDRRDPALWTQGRVSGPDELVDIVRGVRSLENPKVTRRRGPWLAPWSVGTAREKLRTRRPD